MSDYVFFGNQDLGALGYDRWKTDVPEYYDYDEADECDHEDYEVEDCHAYCRCGARWLLTDAQIASYYEHERQAQIAWEREERRERIRQFFAPLRALLNRFRKPSVADDDDIPF